LYFYCGLVVSFEFEFDYALQTTPPTCPETIFRQLTLNALQSLIATKALACKLAKAAWHVMHDDAAYDPQRVFGGGPEPDLGETSREPAKGSGHVEPAELNGRG
jgi:hypothetical protein